MEKIVQDILDNKPVFKSLLFATNNNNLGYVIKLSAALKVNTILTILDLRYNKLDSEQVKYICEALKINTTLREVDLGYNEVGDDGAKHISDALKMNIRLTSLNLRQNNICCDGATYLAESLKANTILKNLVLLNNRIDNVGAKQLAKALEMNVVLTSFAIQNNPGYKCISYCAFIFDRNVDICKIIRSCIYYIIGIRKKGYLDDMGFFGKLPKEIVFVIAKEVWASRGSCGWLAVSQDKN